MSRPFNVRFTGKYNTRISKANALSSASGVVGAGIVGVMIVGASAGSADKDERYINCFLTSEGGREYIVKRPGMAALNTPRTGHVGSAIHVWAGSGSGTSVISAFGTTSTLYSGTSSLGAITGKCSGITETFVGATPTLVVSSGDNSAWYYDGGVGVMTQITDSDFPGASKTLAGTFAHIDGFACIMTTDGYLYASDLNSVTSWGPNSRVLCNAYPDMGVGCVKFKEYIMGFGTQSVQFFRNMGQTPFPFVLQRDMTAKIGCISADAIAEISDNIFFAGSTPEGGCSIFQYDGQFSRISTPEQDFQLVIAGPSNISLTTLRVYGRSFVLVKANTTTFVYCLEDKRWHEWRATTPYWYKCAGLSVGSQILTYSVSNVATTGKVYVVDPASLTFQDDGVAVSAYFQSAADDMGTPNRKFYEELNVAADTEPSTSVLTISYSDDDYASFTTAGTIDLSTGTRRLTRLGSTNPDYGHKRAWKGTHSDNTAMRIEALRGRVDVGDT